MITFLRRFDGRLKRYAIANIAFQAAALLIAGLNLDNGEFLSLFIPGVCLYWILFVVIASVQRQDPTKLSLFVVKWGYFAIWATTVAYDVIRTMRQVLRG